MSYGSKVLEQKFRVLQSAGTCRDLVKPLAKARLRNERNVEEVFYFHTSKYIK